VDVIVDDTGNEQVPTEIDGFRCRRERLLLADGDGRTVRDGDARRGTVPALRGDDLTVDEDGVSVVSNLTALPLFGISWRERYRSHTKWESS
jgi:hypothetical protein